jgi:hypothetical protein
MKKRVKKFLEKSEIFPKILSFFARDNPKKGQKSAQVIIEKETGGTFPAG